MQNGKIKTQNDNLKLKTYDTGARAYRFALRIIDLIDKLPKNLACQVIGKQLLRSATSIGANIIEARSGSSRRDFANFFNHSLKSSNESKFWLNLLKDSGKAENIDGLINLIQECQELSNILASSIMTVKQNAKRKD